MVEILDSNARCKLTTEKVRLIYLPHVSTASTQSVIFTIALQTTKRVNSTPTHTYHMLPHFMRNKPVKLHLSSLHLSSNPFISIGGEKGEHTSKWQTTQHSWIGDSRSTAAAAATSLSDFHTAETDACTVHVYVCVCVLLNNKVLHSSSSPHVWLGCKGRRLCPRFPLFPSRGAAGCFDVALLSAPTTARADGPRPHLWWGNIYELKGSRGEFADTRLFRIQLFSSLQTKIGPPFLPCLYLKPIRLKKSENIALIFIHNLKH